MLNFYAEAGIDTFRNCNFLFQPFLGIMTSYNSWQKNIETGDVATNLIVDSKNYTEVLSRLGGRFHLKEYNGVLLGLDLDWACRLSGEYTTRDITFNSVPMAVSGLNLGRSSIEGSLYAAKKVDRFLTLAIDATFRVWSHAVEGACMASATVNW
jgi:hypothetical protein